MNRNIDICRNCRFYMRQAIHEFIIKFKDDKREFFTCGKSYLDLWNPARSQSHYENRHVPEQCTYKFEMMMIELYKDGH